MDQELYVELLVGCICSGRCMHSPDGSTFLREMTSWPPSWKCYVKSKIRLRQSMLIYLKNTPAKFHPNLIWNDRALCFSEDDRPNKNKNNKMSNDVGSVYFNLVFSQCSIGIYQAFDGQTEFSRVFNFVIVKIWCTQKICFTEVRLHLTMHWTIGLSD